MKFFDRLYGSMEIEGPAKELLSCGMVQRLNHISLSAVPDAFLVPKFFKNMASRLEHSIGMSHLVGILCDFRPEFKEYKNALLLSSICHDAGAPPFSHNGEHLLEELTKMRHERYTEHLLKNSVAEDVIKKYGYTLREITEIINGNGTAGKLMNNSIDLDNMDNTERYGFSSGRIGRISNPEKLAKAFMLSGGNLCLDSRYSGEIEKWKECRRRVYDGIVYSDENISAGGMLIRALGFIYEKEGKELTENGFIMLSDNEALEYMESNCSNAKALIEKARNGILYRKVAEISSANPSKIMEMLCKNWNGRLELADSISGKLNLARTDVCVQAFMRKSERNVSNICPKEEVVQVAEPRVIFDIRVFANPGARVNDGDAQKTVCGLAEMQ